MPADIEAAQLFLHRGPSIGLRYEKREFWVGRHMLGITHDFRGNVSRTTYAVDGEFVFDKLEMQLKHRDIADALFG